MLFDSGRTPAYREESPEGFGEHVNTAHTGQTGNSYNQAQICKRLLIVIFIVIVIIIVVITADLSRKATPSARN